MLTPPKYIVRTWIFISVISITAVKVVGESGEKTFNLKIGFDLTQGLNGAPSLRIRDFEDSSSELKPRAEDFDEVTKKTKPTKVRADIISDSDESVRHSVVPHAKPDSLEDLDSSGGKSKSGENSDADDGDSSDDRKERKSTRGLKAAEYEPEDNVKSNGRYEDSDEDSDRARHKREAHSFDIKRLLTAKGRRSLKKYYSHRRSSN